jgi:phosphoheptose isomerase
MAKTEKFSRIEEIEMIIQRLKNRVKIAVEQNSKSLENVIIFNGKLIELYRNEIKELKNK